MDDELARLSLVARDALSRAVASTELEHFVLDEVTASSRHRGSLRAHAVRDGARLELRIDGFGSGGGDQARSSIRVDLGLRGARVQLRESRRAKLLLGWLDRWRDLAPPIGVPSFDGQWEVSAHPPALAARIFTADGVASFDALPAASIAIDDGWLELRWQGVLDGAQLGRALALADHARRAIERTPRGSAPSSDQR